MNPDPMSSDWFIWKEGTPFDQLWGPFTWEQMLSYGQTDRLSPRDQIWHELWGVWTPAAQISGLFAAPAKDFVEEQKPRCDWYFYGQGTAHGPHVWGEIDSWARKGQIGPDFLLWHPSVTDWTPASEIPALRESLAAHIKRASARKKTRWVAFGATAVASVAILAWIGISIGSAIPDYDPDMFDEAHEYFGIERYSPHSSPMRNDAPSVADFNGRYLGIAVVLETGWESGDEYDPDNELGYATGQWIDIQVVSGICYFNGPLEVGDIQEGIWSYGGDTGIVGKPQVGDYVGYWEDGLALLWGKID